MTVLSSMNDAEFAKYLAVAIPGYAQGKVESGQWAETDSLELSRKTYADLLPQGLKTQNNFLFTVHDGVSAESIGMVWFAAQDRGAQRVAFVYDVSIDSAHQRRGHATRAFAALEAEVHSSGLSGIALHVFGKNTGAQALYHKLGFVTTNINMFKQFADAKA